MQASGVERALLAWSPSRVQRSTTEQLTTLPLQHAQSIQTGAQLPRLPLSTSTRTWQNEVERLCTSGMCEGL